MKRTNVHSASAVRPADPSGLAGRVHRVRQRGEAWIGRVRLRSGPLLTPRPGLLCLLLLLLALCVVLLSWGVDRGREPAGFDLLADASSSKLKDTSAEARLEGSA